MRIEIVDVPEVGEEAGDQEARDQAIGIRNHQHRFMEKVQALQDAGINPGTVQATVKKARDAKVHAKAKALRKAQKQARRAGR